jgi:hypothetical protein
MGVLIEGSCEKEDCPLCKIDALAKRYAQEFSAPAPREATKARTHAPTAKLPTAKLLPEAPWGSRFQVLCFRAGFRVGRSLRFCQNVLASFWRRLPGSRG